MSTSFFGNDHFISLEKAKEMTARFRKERDSLIDPAYRANNPLPICESYDRAAFDALLAKKECRGIRIYLGLDAANQVRPVIVAVNENGEDILPSSDGLEGGSDIVDEGSRCPTDCPPPSPLNE